MTTHHDEAKYKRYGVKMAEKIKDWMDDGSQIIVNEIPKMWYDDRSLKRCKPLEVLKLNAR